MPQRVAASPTRIAASVLKVSIGSRVLGLFFLESASDPRNAPGLGWGAVLCLFRPNLNPSAHPHGCTIQQATDGCARAEKLGWGMS
jgi:hypothetical protein